MGPLIKWAGGKRWLVPELHRLLPTTYGRYFEPFVGGGALFFDLVPERARLADLNADLINFYRTVRDDPDELIRHLKGLKNTKRNYFRVRSTNPRVPARRAARFLYLTRLSFNSIYRVNLQGEFNVPYGDKSYLDVCDEPTILAASSVLQNATFAIGDFEATTKDAVAGDMVYFDPPYTVAHGNNGFVKYNETIFQWADQIRLAKVFSNLAARGCHVFLSNADHPSIRGLYEQHRVVTIKRYSGVGSKSEYRRHVSEVLVTTHP